MQPETHLHSGTRFNALKHGLYAEAVLLPRDDMAEFRRRRRAAFHRYRPQTEDEAFAVESIVEQRWLFERWRSAQATFDGQAVEPAEDVAGRVGEPGGHKRLHSSTDVTIHRQRIERMGNRALARLGVLQKQRRLGLIEGAVKLPKDCYMETDGRVLGPVVQSVIVPLPEPELETDNLSVAASADGGNGNSQEPKERGGVAPQKAGGVGTENGQPDGITAWAAFPGEIVILGMIDDVVLPARDAA